MLQSNEFLDQGNRLQQLLSSPHGLPTLHLQHKCQSESAHRGEEFLQEARRSLCSQVSGKGSWNVELPDWFFPGKDCRLRYPPRKLGVEELSILVSSVLPVWSDTFPPDPWHKFVFLSQSVEPIFMGFTKK